MKIENYDRALSVHYATKYALRPNTNYYNFSKLGGDCTNFCSQCLYAGCKQMNFTKDLGWYYTSLINRAPAWTGAKEFYSFLTNNIVVNKIGEGYGPFAEPCKISKLLPGDFIFLCNPSDKIYHTLILVDKSGNVPLVASHSRNVYKVPLASYKFHKALGLRILGVRKE